MLGWPFPERMVGTCQAQGLACILGVCHPGICAVGTAAPCLTDETLRLRDG